VALRLHVSRISARLLDNIATNERLRVQKNTTLDRNRHDYSVVVLSLTAC